MADVKAPPEQASPDDTETLGDLVGELVDRVRHGLQIFPNAIDDLRELAARQRDHVRDIPLAVFQRWFPRRYVAEINRRSEENRREIINLLVRAFRLNMNQARALTQPRGPMRLSPGDIQQPLRITDLDEGVQRAILDLIFRQAVGATGAMTPDTANPRLMPERAQVVPLLRLSDRQVRRVVNNMPRRHPPSYTSITSPLDRVMLRDAEPLPNTVPNSSWARAAEELRRSNQDVNNVHLNEVDIETILTAGGTRWREVVDPYREALEAFQARYEELDGVQPEQISFLLRTFGNPKEATEALDKTVEAIDQLIPGLAEDIRLRVVLHNPTDPLGAAASTVVHAPEITQWNQDSPWDPALAQTLVAMHPEVAHEVASEVEATANVMMEEAAWEGDRNTARATALLEPVAARDYIQVNRGRGRAAVPETLEVELPAQDGAGGGGADGDQVDTTTGRVRTRSHGRSHVVPKGRAPGPVKFGEGPENDFYKIFGPPAPIPGLPLLDQPVNAFFNDTGADPEEISLLMWDINQALRADHLNQGGTTTHDGSHVTLRQLTSHSAEELAASPFLSTQQVDLIQRVLRTLGLRLRDNEIARTVRSGDRLFRAFSTEDIHDAMSGTVSRHDIIGLQARLARYYNLPADQITVGRFMRLNERILLRLFDDSIGQVAIAQRLETLRRRYVGHMTDQELPVFEPRSETVRTRMRAGDPRERGRAARARTHARWRERERAERDNARRQPEPAGEPETVGQPESQTVGQAEPETVGIPGSETSGQAEPETVGIPGSETSGQAKPETVEQPGPYTVDTDGYEGALLDPDPEDKVGQRERAQRLEREQERDRGGDQDQDQGGGQRERGQRRQRGRAGQPAGPDGQGGTGRGPQGQGGQGGTGRGPQGQGGGRRQRGRAGQPAGPGGQGRGSREGGRSRPPRGPQAIISPNAGPDPEDVRGSGQNGRAAPAQPPAAQEEQTPVAGEWPAHPNQTRRDANDATERARTRDGADGGGPSRARARSGPGARRGAGQRSGPPGGRDNGADQADHGNGRGQAETQEDQGPAAYPNSAPAPGSWLKPTKAADQAADAPAGPGSPPEQNTGTGTAANSPRARSGGRRGPGSSGSPPRPAPSRPGGPVTRRPGRNGGSAATNRAAEAAARNGDDARDDANDRPGRNGRAAGDPTPAAATPASDAGPPARPGPPVADSPPVQDTPAGAPPAAGQSLSTPAAPQTPTR